MGALAVKFGARVPKPQFRWSIPGFTGTFFGAGLLTLGEMGSALVFSALGAATGFMICYVRKKMYLNRRFKVAKSYFEKQGHKVEFQLIPQLLISPRTKTIAIVDGFLDTYDEYRFSEILGWEHSWTNKTESSSSVLGGKARSNTQEVKNVLTIKTNNPYKPLYDFHLFAHSHGQLWVARFEALFSRGR